MQEYEDKCAKHGYDETDSSEEEETLFKEEGEEEEEVSNKPKPNSYWGKNINKSSTLDHFIKKR